MKEARTVDSSLLDGLLNQIPAAEKQIQIEKMQLAIKIADAMKAKGWNKKQFANAMDVTSAVITKWLSGTHNFTFENLVKIGCVLDVHLVDTKLENPKTMLLTLLSFKKRKVYKLRTYVQTTNFMNVAEPMELNSSFTVRQLAL